MTSDEFIKEDTYDPNSTIYFFQPRWMQVFVFVLFALGLLFGLFLFLLGTALVQDFPNRGFGILFLVGSLLIIPASLWILIKKMWKGNNYASADKLVFGAKALLRRFRFEASWNDVVALEIYEPSNPLHRAAGPLPRYVYIVRARDNRIGQIRADEKLVAGVVVKRASLKEVKNVRGIYEKHPKHKGVVGAIDSTLDFIGGGKPYQLRKAYVKNGYKGKLNLLHAASF